MTSRKYEKGERQQSVLLLVCADVVAILIISLAAYPLAAVVQYLLGLDTVSFPKLVNDRAIFFASGLLYILVSFLFAGHYHRRIPFWIEAKQVMSYSAFALIIEAFIVFSAKAEISRLVLFVSWLSAPLAILTLRYSLKAFLRSRGRGIMKLVVVASPERRTFAKLVLTRDRHLGYRCISDAGVASVADIITCIERVSADGVLVALSGDNSDEVELVAGLRARGVDVLVLLPDLSLSSTAEVQYFLGENAIVLVEQNEIVPLLSRAGKRGFDVALAAGLLAALLPMLIFIAALVKADGGPVLFSHRRIGTDGRSFPCLKFRTMCLQAEQRLESVLAASETARKEWLDTRKLKNDPRITKIGRFLRRSGLDELPQLLNVIRGDMSLIGPRPVTEEEIERYGGKADLYRSVRPGITGLWQVSGRNDISYDDRVALDAWYVRNWSAWHDIAILAKTFPAIIKRSGAY